MTILNPKFTLTGQRNKQGFSILNLFDNPAVHLLGKNIAAQGFQAEFLRNKKPCLSNHVKQNRLGFCPCPVNVGQCKLFQTVRNTGRNAGGKP